MWAGLEPWYGHADPDRTAKSHQPRHSIHVVHPGCPHCRLSCHRCWSPGSCLLARQSCRRSLRQSFIQTIYRRSCALPIVDRAIGPGALAHVCWQDRAAGGRYDSHSFDLLSRVCPPYHLSCRSSWSSVSCFLARQGCLRPSPQVPIPTFYSTLCALNIVYPAVGAGAPAHVCCGRTGLLLATTPGIPSIPSTLCAHPVVYPAAGAGAPAHVCWPDRAAEATTTGVPSTY